MKQSRKLMILIGLITVIAISACSSDSNTTPTAILRGAIVPTRISTNTPTATSTATHTPTVTPTPTNTPSPTITPTDTPTLTPTIDAEIVASYIEDGDTLIELGSIDRAINRYTDAIELDPDASQAFLGRGLGYYRAGDYESALSDFTAAINLDPTLNNAYYNRGLTHMELLNSEAAFEDFSTVINLDPTDYEAHYQLGLLHFEFEEFDEGFEKLQTAIDINPSYAEAYGARGMVYYLEGDYTNALTELENYVFYAGDNATQDMINLLDDTRTQLATLTPLPTPEPPPPTPTSDIVGQTAPQPITFDESIDATITQDVYEYLYEFTANAGDRVDIKMIATDGTLDPLLLLLNEAEDVVTENDDDPNNTGRDSFIQGFVIPDDGQYTIVATRFQQQLGSTTGSFTVILEQSPDQATPPTPTPSGDSNMIEYGDTVTGEINDDTYAISYEFTANQGDRIDIQMIANDDEADLDPLLILENANGDTLAENDDDPDGTGRNSFIHTFEIPADGTYTIVATRFQQELGSTTGTFDVILQLADSDAINLSDPEEVAYGDEFTGEITRNSGSLTLTFEGEAGDIINIRMQATSGTLDPFLILLDESGDELIRNDDDEQGIGRDSFIREFVIPSDGTYTIIATRFQQDNGTTTGRFTLTIEEFVTET